MEASGIMSRLQVAKIRGVIQARASPGLPRRPNRHSNKEQTLRLRCARLFLRGFDYAFNDVSRAHAG